MTRIMIVDDHGVVRLGLRNLLSRQPNWTVVAEASTADEAVRRAEESGPDLIVMDIRLGDGSSGLRACRAIRQRQSETKILRLTSFAKDDLIIKAVAAEAVGYILKQIG